MALPINSFADYVFNKLYATTLLSSLNLSENGNVPSTVPSAKTPTLELTTALLKNFSFVFNDVERAFRLADGLQAYTGKGNSQLTRQEIQFYLEYTQSSNNAQYLEESNLFILLLLDYYFDQLADVELLTPYGHYQAISLEQLRALAAFDGESENLTFQDIELYLRRKAEAVLSAGHSEMESRQPEIIEKAGEKQQFLPMKTLTQKSGKAYHPTVEAVQPAGLMEQRPKIDLPESEELVTRAQIFSFNVSEVLQLIRAEKRPISLPDLEKSLKVVEAYQLDLERIMQSITPSTTSSVCFSKSVLTKQLGDARRAAATLRVLKQHFNDIAQVDGDATGISKEDIETLAALDGNIENLSLDDLKMFRKSKT